MMGRGATKREGRRERDRKREGEREKERGREREREDEEWGGKKERER